MSPRTEAPRLSQCALTHRGHVRNINEDSILSRPELGLWAVSDGMGGHAAGDFASRTVTAALEALPADADPANIPAAARAALNRAHAEIRAEGDRLGQITIGATVVLLVIAEGYFMCLWVGDSRLYRIRDGGIEMISADHSVVGELVQQGYLDWDEAENHPHANQITRAVGVGETLEIDKRRGEVLPGDRFLLCSDGLTRYARAETLRRMLDGATLDSAGAGLMQIALDGGGADNISLIVVEA
ncbi:protein phosphatase 2C domain-containing protein [Sulfitobacter sp. LCG007]